MTNYADIGGSKGVRLFHTDDGPRDAARTLLLVHGWGSDSQEWIWHIPSLARDHRVIAADLRGHGHSSAPGSGNTPRAMTEDLIRLARDLDVHKVVAVGHSMGGQIVSHLAVEHPEFVEAFVTIDPGYGFSGPVADAFPRMISTLRDGDTHATAVRLCEWNFTDESPDWLRTWHTRRVLATPPHVLIEAFAAMFGGDAPLGIRAHGEAYLRRRDRPQLLVGRDPERTRWEAAMFTHAPSTAVVWEGSGHYLHEERPEEFLAVLTKWLSEVF